MRSIARRNGRIVVALAGAIVLAGSTALAQEAGPTVTRRGEIAEDLYLGGGTVDVRARVAGDVVAAGGRILIEDRVSGDVIAAGGLVDLGAEVLDDVRAAGGTVIIRGPVAGDAVVAGGRIHLAPEATVGGRAWLAGGEVEVAGRVATHLKVWAGTVELSGVVEGDVEITADEVDILPTARVDGTLIYRSPREARIAPDAVISGGVTYVAVKGPSMLGRVLGQLVFVLVAGFLGSALFFLFPSLSVGAIRSLGAEPLKALGVGAVALFGLPLVAVLLIVTVVGSALGIALLVLYGLMLVAGFLAGALCTGEYALRAARGGRAPATLGPWIGALLIGLLLIDLVALVPVLGGLICFTVLLFGLGALVLQLFREWQAGRTETVLREAT